MRMRRLIGFCCAAVLGCVAPARVSLAAGSGSAPEDSARLVREVVYNELHDHDSHGYWRYWIEHRQGKDVRVEEQVETADGPVTRAEFAGGRPLTGTERDEEDRRLRRLLESPREQAEHRKAYAEDEHRIGRILALLPDAFLYDPAEAQMLGDTACWHLSFHPNPAYPARSIEARIFHAMAGDLWISVQSKHLVRLDGRLKENVDFGYGILGRLYKDGWFRLERTHVGGSAGAGDWKTQRLEVHMAGRAMLFKTIAHETSEVRGGFAAVPAGLSLQQAVLLIQQPVNVAHNEPTARMTTR